MTIKKDNKETKVAAKPKRAAAPKAAARKAKDDAAAPTGTYFSAVGRRKSAIAQVRVYPSGHGQLTVNGRPMRDYFPVDEHQDAVMLPLKTLGMDATADVTAKTMGGGLRGQADAVKLGISRALLKFNADYRASLKPLGALTRDPREKERKKYGLKKARKSPQWAKR